MAGTTRRRFLEDSMFATAAALAAGAVTPGLVLAAGEAGRSSSPNEKLVGAVIGVNGRGGEHIHAYAGRKDVEIGYICDIDTKVGNRRCDEIGKSAGRRPQYVQDLRKMLEDKTVDFVSIATPNHWHSLAAIWAMQAGKDVYVEKPVSHNVSEGRRDVQTAAKHGRICQAGTQSRSSPALHEAVAYLKSGKLGTVNLARALCYKPRGPIGPKGKYPIPKEVDYDLWSGPAQIKPLTRPHLHYDWHWQWDYGNGDLGNQGVHQMDIARWGLGLDRTATSVIAYGGRFGYEDAGETPNTEITILEFGDKTLAFEVRGLKTNEFEGARVGVIFYGTEGTMVVPDYSMHSVFDPKGKLLTSFKHGGDHFSNFLHAVRSRNAKDLNAPILEGHLSAALCHMGNISYRLGDLHSAGETAERLKEIKTHEKVQETLDRTIAHLAENSVKLDEQTKFRVGSSLQFDPAAETFTGNDAANRLLTRDYRAPFVVPSADQV